MPKFSEETLRRIRRMRKARRLFRYLPLFAFSMMLVEYHDYDYDTFIRDVTPRRRKKRKKVPKTPLARYGRFWEMRHLVRQYKESKEPVIGLKADLLRKNMTRPYRVLLQIGRECREHAYPATYSYSTIRDFAMKARQCRSWIEIDALEADCMRNANVS